ncbi:MAG: hypothetical protein HQ522_14365 [Bacteroidetes bacterium]|nr:hypothetical protein [Bacteroidota bacterium]
MLDEKNKMFKKASHIILSLLLLTTTIGVAISKHYCGGNLISTSFFTEAKSCCDSDDCCKNESEVFQLDEDFSPISITEIPVTVELDLFSFAMLILDEEIVSTEQKQEFIVSDLPPPPKIQTALSQRQTYLL